MNKVLERLQDYALKGPDIPVLFDELHAKGLTYSQLDEISGKVYGWLKEQRIGKEDFVLIRLPRGILPIVAMLGIWKAGAAWALVEDTYAPERIDFIRKDCGCKLEISAENWDEIMRHDSLPGFEPADDHDAAYAIYTSGTTGNPKGVLHEVGNLEMAVQSIKVNGTIPFQESDRCALLAPMNFVASVIFTVTALSIYGGRNYVVSYETIKNPGALARFFLSKRITITFLTPSYVRKLGGNTGPFLRMLFVGSEPANNLYNRKLDMINIYAASESGFAVGSFKIDKPYETCPIGRPQVDIRIRLLDEDGKEVPAGEIGELCFENPYVRGYIHLPEENARAFTEGMFHSGDLARLDENGNYILLGRRGDMIKINGNRIEPAEIEAAVKEALGIKWCAVRGFEDADKSFLCAYYTEDVTFDKNELREELLRRLPYYMIPSYFMKIDSVPLKPNGKMDRMALPEPDSSDFQSSYVAPENETQEAICEAMAEALHIGRVGIRDDFYEMGGDSLSAIETISKCALHGLTTSMIFRGRTPEKIAALYEEFCQNNQGGSIDDINEESIAEEHLLTTEQTYMVDYQLYTPDSTMFNLYSMLKVDPEVIDLEALMEAVDTVIHHHPALLTTMHFRKDGSIVQRYTPDCARELYIEKLTDWEFRNAMKDTLVQPFQVIGGTLYRCRFFRTEKAGYLFFDVHHTVSDGTSMKVLMADIIKAYMGMDLDKDYYYAMLRSRETVHSTPFYKECRRYFEDRYEGIAWSTHPKVDQESRENDYGCLTCSMGILQPQMNAIERAYRVSRNEFFIAVAGLAISLYNDASDIKVCWIYNGREESHLINTVGLLYRDLPVGMRLSDSLTLRELFSDVHDQVEQGIAHSCYPYVEMNANTGISENELVCVLYQRDIREVSGPEDFNISTVDIRQNHAASENILDIQILDASKGLEMTLDFSASRYKLESMKRFQELYIKLAQEMVTHSSQSDITIREIREKVADRKSFFHSFMSIFTKKR